MKKKKISTYINSHNIYDLGGWKDDVNTLKNITSDQWGEALTNNAGVITSGINLLGDAMKQTIASENSNLNNKIKNIQNQTYSANNTTDLLNAYNNRITLSPNLTSSYFRDSSNDGSNILKSGLSGASAGLSVGGLWGALIGGVAGLATSGIRAIVGNSRAKDMAKAYNNKIKIANRNNNLAFGNAVDNLKTNTYNNLMATSMAYGGNLNTSLGDFTNDITFFNNGGTHEENPYGGIPQGIAEDGQPNLVEEGEVKFKDYIFSNRLTVPKAFRKKYKLGGKLDLTFADAAKKMQEESEERPNDPISKRGLEDSMAKLQIAQEQLKQENEMKKQQEAIQYMANGGYLGHKYSGGSKLNIDYNPAYNKNDAIKYSELGLDDYFDYTPFIQGLSPEEEGYLSGQMDLLAADAVNKENNKFNWKNALMFGPAAVNALTGAIDAFIPSDYSNPERIEKVANNIPQITGKPIGNYLTYNPFDIIRYTNNLNAQNALALSTHINNANGNRQMANANIMASMLNGQTQFGNLVRQGEESNFAQRQAVENYNGNINQFNSETALKTDMANQEAYKTKLQGIISAATLRDQIESAKSNSISQNLTNIGDNLSDIGKMYATFDLINSNPAFAAMITDNFTLEHKPHKKGGYLTIKNKRRK